MSKPDRLFKARLRLILLIAFAAVFVFSATMLILDCAQGAKEENVLKNLAVISADSPELPVPPSGSTRTNMKRIHV